MAHIKINDITPEIFYTATAGQTIFPYPFPIFEDTDLVVEINGTPQSITADYTVSGAGSDNGGDVTLIVGASLNDSVVIYRVVPKSRTTDLPDSGAIVPSVINDDLDRIVAMIQELIRANDKEFGFSSSVPDVGGVSISLGASARADLALGFDSAGNLVAKTLFDPTLIDQASLDKRHDVTFADTSTMTSITPVDIDGNSVTIVAGQTIHTQGRSSANDGGKGTYYVVSGDSSNGYDKLLLGNGTTAILQEGAPSAKQFGILADNTDETAKVQALIDFGAPVVDLAGLTIRCDTAVTLASDQVVQNGVLDFSNGADALTAVTATGSMGAADVLTANVAFGDTTLAATDGTAFSGGDVIYISDTQNWSSGTPQGEFQIIKSISGNTLTLTSKTKGQYLTASSAQIEKLIPVENVILDNIKLIGKGYSGTETQNGIVLNKCRNIKFRNCQFDSFAQRLIRMVQSYDMAVFSSSFFDSDQPGFGYGVAIADGCHHVQVEGNSFDLMRHAVTLGGSFGVNRFVTVSGNTGTGMKDAMLDTHAEADFTVFTNNTGSFIEDNASDDAVALQGANAVVSGNVFTGTVRGGVLHQQQVLAGMIESPSSVVVDGNQFLSGGTGTGIFIDTSASGCEAMEGVIVTDNVCQGFDSVGISINASNADISGVNVSGNHCSMGDNGVKFDTDSTYSITGGIISNNHLSMATDATESIRLIGASAGSISVVGINGNVIRNGTNGIRLSTADKVMITSNQTDGLTGAVVNTGTATNVTQANNA